MPKRIRYLSGNAAGMIATLEDTEAENAIATGFAELAPEEPAAAEPEAPAPMSSESEPEALEEPTGDEPEEPKAASRKKGRR